MRCADRTPQRGVLPMLVTMEKFELIPFVDSITLAHTVAGKWLDEVKRAAQRGERHSVAFAGGRITRWFYEAAAELSQVRGISFEQENIRWAERALTIIGRRLPVQA